MSTVVIAQITLEIWGALFSLLGAAIIFILNGPRKNSANTIFNMMITNAVGLLSDCLAYYYRGNTSTLGVFATRISNTMFFLVELFLTFLFIRFTKRLFLESGAQENKVFTKIIISLLLIGTAIIVVNCFTGWMFDFDEANCYYRKTGWYYFMLIIVLVSILLIAFVVKHRNTFSRFMWISMLVYLMIPFLMMCLQIVFYGLSLTNVGITISLFLMIIGFEREKAKELVSQNEVIELGKSGILLGQIKPHFIQNCLSSIRGLCYENADKAAELINNLSGYLRDTFVFMEKNEPISFEKELELVDFYLYIEQIRFPNHIEIHKDIKVSDFNIPPLTVQPMVENAIRHGIRGKNQKGNLYIRTYQKDDTIQIEIQDDGVGFDSTLNKSKEEHVGIRNVRQRLEIMSKGSLKVESKIGEGTLVTIIIPSN